MAVYAGLKLSVALGLSFFLLLQLRSIIHRCGETSVHRFGGHASLGGLEGVDAGFFAKHGAAFVVFPGTLTLHFSLLLVELTRKLGLCCPQQIFDGLFPVIH